MKPGRGMRSGRFDCTYAIVFVSVQRYFEHEIYGRTKAGTRDAICRVHEDALSHVKGFFDEGVDLVEDRV